jgi:chromosome segregation ATPase
MSPRITRLGLVLAFAAAAAPLHAQVQRSGGGGESQKIMQQYQQIAAEKTALQSQLAQMKTELDAAKTELASAKKERDALKAHAGEGAAAAAATARLSSEKQAAEKSAEQNKQRLTELVARFRETANNLKEVEADRSKLRGELQERSTAYDKCAEANLGLFEVTSDLLNRYEHIGPFTKISSAEPFTRITRTRIENLVDEYRERAQELRVKKQAGPAAQNPK